MELRTTDSPKMLRETLCLAQTLFGAHIPQDVHSDHSHSARLQRLIDECDRHRPLGPDGKHGDRHTGSCGCDPAMMAIDFIEEHYGVLYPWQKDIISRILLEVKE